MDVWNWQKKRNILISAILCHVHQNIHMDDVCVKATANRVGIIWRRTAVNDFQLLVYPKVDKHIRKLDADLARFEADLREKSQNKPNEEEKTESGKKSSVYYVLSRTVIHPHHFHLCFVMHNIKCWFHFYLFSVCFHFLKMGICLFVCLLIYWNVCWTSTGHL